MTDTELAWAAGFWDGEGHTGVTRNRIVAQVVQTDKMVLERFQRAVGIGKLYGPYCNRGRDRRRNKDYWQLHMDGFVQVNTLFSKLLPYLSRPKTAQFTAAIERFHNRPKKAKGANRKVPREQFLNFQHLSTSELARMFGCHPSLISYYRKTERKWKS